MRIRTLTIMTPAALLLGLGIAGSGDAAGPATQSGKSAASGQSQAGAPTQSRLSQQQQPQGSAQHNRLLVTDAESLIDARVNDTGGKEVGRIKYLMISPASGDVIFAVLSSGESVRSEEPFFAVPLEGLDVAGWHGAQGRASGIDLTVSPDKLGTAPRYAAEDLIRLTSPKVQREIHGAFGTPDTGSAAAELTPPPGSAKDDVAKPHILLGQGTVTTVLDPLIRLDNQMSGSAVYTGDGKQFGEIDKLMVDVENGQVAYALVGSGKYLGMGGRRAAIPIQALEWSSEGRYVLTEAAGKEIEGKPPIDPAATLPTEISRQDLTDLYQRFDVEPYWKQG